MRTATMLVALLVGLSGCSSNESGTPAADDQHVQDDGTGLASDDNETVPETNLTMPSLVFTAGAVDGTAPVTVSFTLDALNATDVRNATWTITSGDLQEMGVGLPASANLTFETAGNHSVTASAVVDGFDLVAHHNVTIEGGVASGVHLETVNWGGSGSLVTGFQWCGFQEGLDRGTHTWDATALRSDDYVIANLVFDFDVSTTASAVRLDVFGPAGSEIGRTTAGLLGGNGQLTIAGPFPPGQFQAIAKICTGVAVDYEFTMTADLLTP